MYLLTKETELLLASASELETKYDNACKVLFSNKEIIAPILKYVIPEFNNLSVKEIIACIDEVSNGKYVSENIQIQQDKAEQNYDMMEIVFIYRQDDEEKLEDNFGTEREQSVFDYLTSVFACDIDRLSSYIGGRIHEKIRKEVITMTGLGASIRKKSEAKGRAEGRAVGQSEGKRLGERTGTYKTYYMFMRDGKITLEEIADRLHITADEYMREMDKILEEDEVGSLL